MWTKQLRSAGALLLAAIAAVSYQPPTIAQLEPERPRVALTQVPSLIRELWPADFNEDGVTDLVAEQANTGVIVQIGVGDGTFGTPYPVADGFTPVGVGDLNRDGYIDILMVVRGTTTGYVLAGHGDGTFTGPAAIQIALNRPTYVRDMNNDGVPDLVTARLPETPTNPAGRDIRVYPGNGNFTFGEAVILGPGPVQYLLVGMVPADINGDGLLDIAAHSAFTSGIDIYENLGNFTFAARAIPLDGPGAGIAARDLNGDGIVDLVAGMGTFDTRYWRSGFLYVLLGTGGGTFGPPVRYPVNVGPVLVVTGDFNGDGIPDVATGNQSTVQRCHDEILYFWDSVSILPGRGDGTFGPTASFALDYRAAFSRLNTSDLNADGRTDLLASPGAILLSLPPGPNSAPVADAGPDRMLSLFNTGQDFLRGSATDADHDWLTFEWKDDLGRVLTGDRFGGGLPAQCFSAGNAETNRVYTLTVRDDLGGSSSDSTQWTLYGARDPGPIPEAFGSTNIGDATDGFSGFLSGSEFRLAGSGTDIWGTSDSFRYVHTSVSGNFDVTTRVSSIENIDPWTKAGLMVREKLTGDSRHASLFATPTSAKGVVFQRREFEGGESVHTAGPATAPPVWLRLVRDGDVMTASTRVNQSESWSVIGSQTLSSLSDTVYVGMAVTSHRTGTLATAFFQSFALTLIPREVVCSTTNFTDTVGNHWYISGGQAYVENTAQGWGPWNTAAGTSYATAPHPTYGLMIYLNQSGTWLEWDFAGSGGWIASSGPSGCNSGVTCSTTNFTDTVGNHWYIAGGQAYVENIAQGWGPWNTAAGTSYATAPHPTYGLMIYLNQSGTWLEWHFAGSGGWIASSGPSACGGGSGLATTSFYPVADTLLQEKDPNNPYTSRRRSGRLRT